MQDYLKKYLDSPVKKNKVNSNVVYRKVNIVDNDNIDQLMGRLVDNDQIDDLVPVFVETLESKQINQKDKQAVLDRINNQKRGKRSRQNSQASSSVSSSSVSSSNAESDSNSDLSVQRNTRTVYRNPQTGQQISIQQKIQEDEKVNQDKRKEAGKQNERALEENQRQINTWGRGLIQAQQKKTMEQEMISGKGKDEKRELDLHLIRQNQFADPMRNILIKEEQTKMNITNKSQILKKSKFPTIPNRYGIEAGHRWDGVDRSNGYEKKYLILQNERKDNSTRSIMDHMKNI